MDRLLVTTDEQETTRSRIRRLEQDLEMATEELAKMALSGPQIQEPVTPITVQNKDTLIPVHSNKTPVMESAPDVVAAQAKELAELKEELAAQEALRTREKELKKAVEEEQRKTAENLRRAEENLRKGHIAFDRLKEEKEKLLKEKDDRIRFDSLLGTTEQTVYAQEKQEQR